MGFIQFIILLDNNAKRIYAKYMQKEDNYLSLIENQKELEQRITSTVLSMNVNKNNESNINMIIIVDIFSLNEFLIVSKITKEMAIFIGSLQDDNEIVLIKLK